MPSAPKRAAPGSSSWAAKGAEPRLDAAIAGLRGLLTNPGELENGGRRVAERMALALQGALLVRHGDAVMAEAFCRTRLDRARGDSYGTLPANLPCRDILERARPDLA